MRCLSPTGLYSVLAVLDSAIAILVVFPLTCMYFRGIWDLIGHYVLPGQAPLQYWVYVLIGQLQLLGLVILPYVDAHLDRTQKVKYWVLSRLFMYVYTLPYMFYWHGLWLLMNHYFGTDWQYSAATLAFTYSAMCVMGSCRSCMWPPFFIAMDNQPDSLTMVSRFKSKFQKGSYRDYVTDAYLAQLVILGMSICCWRSTFNIIQHFLRPDDGLQSDILSAEIGVIGCTIMLGLQWPLGQVSIKLSQTGHHTLKLLWEDAMYLVTFGVLTFIWKGVWNLNCRYVMPQMPQGAWLNFLAGSIGLLVMQTFTEVCNFGITDDGADPGGEAFYPVHYLRILYRDRWDSEGTKTVSKDDKNGPDYDSVSQKDLPLNEKTV